MEIQVPFYNITLLKIEKLKREASSKESLSQPQFYQKSPSKKKDLNFKDNILGKNFQCTLDRFQDKT